MLKDIGWGAYCLTEDIEFTMKLAQNNIKVGWANDAIVYDEKPLTLSQSWKQRVRWMQGHSDVASRYFFKLMKTAIREKSLFKFDCALYLIQPLRIITMGVITLMAWAQTVYPDGNWGFFQIWYIFPSASVWSIFITLQFFFTPFVLFTEKKLNTKIIIYCFTFLFYSLTWVPITIIGVMNRNKKEWFHTQHTRQITISDIEKS